MIWTALLDWFIVLFLVLKNRCSSTAAVIIIIKQRCRHHHDPITMTPPPSAHHSTAQRAISDCSVGSSWQKVVACCTSATAQSPRRRKLRHASHQRSSGVFVLVCLYCVCVCMFLRWCVCRGVRTIPMELQTRRFRGPPLHPPPPHTHIKKARTRPVEPQREQQRERERVHLEHLDDGLVRKRRHERRRVGVVVDLLVDDEHDRDEQVDRQRQAAARDYARRAPDVDRERVQVAPLRPQVGPLARADLLVERVGARVVEELLVRAARQAREVGERALGAVPPGVCVACVVWMFG